MITELNQLMSMDKEQLDEMIRSCQTDERVIGGLESYLTILLLVKEVRFLDSRIRNLYLACDKAKVFHPKDNNEKE